MLEGIDSASLVARVPAAGLCFVLTINHEDLTFLRKHHLSHSEFFIISYGRRLKSMDVGAVDPDPSSSSLQFICSKRFFFPSQEDDLRLAFVWIC